MSKQRRGAIALLPVSPLLITESEDEFDRIRDAFDQELKPRGIIEQMYVADIACIASEVFTPHCEAGVVDAALLPGLGTSCSAVFRRPGGLHLGVAQKRNV